MKKITYVEDVPIRFDDLTSLNSINVGRGDYEPLVKWRHAFKTVFYSNWNMKTKVSLGPGNDTIPGTDWNEIGVLYGGGKESLLTLALLRELTDKTIHVITMGNKWEANQLVSRLKAMRKYGMTNVKIHIAYLNKNPNRTWAQLIGCLAICQKQKIGRIFFGSEGDYHAFNTRTKQISQYLTAGVPMNELGSNAVAKCGFPVEFTSLVYPLSAWNAMHVLKERYPDYTKHMMCYKPGWSKERRFRNKTGGTVKTVRSVLYAQSMNLKIDNRQEFLINKLIPRLFAKSEYFDDYKHKVSYVPYTLEAKHSMYKLGILPNHAQEHKWVERPYLNFKQHIPKGFEEVWDIFVDNTGEAPQNVTDIAKDVTLDSVDETRNLITKCLNNLDVVNG